MRQIRRDGQIGGESILYCVCVVCVQTDTVNVYRKLCDASPVGGSIILLHYIIDTSCAVLVISNTIEECLMLPDGSEIIREYTVRIQKYVAFPTLFVK